MHSLVAYQTDHPVAAEPVLAAFSRWQAKRDGLAADRALAQLWRASPQQIAGGHGVALALPALDALLGGCLPCDILVDISPRMVARRQLSYLAGRLCAERAVWQASGQLSKVGRHPVLGPQWPQGLTGSITHHDELAVAVVGAAATGMGLGIDSEKVVSEAQCEAIILLCCTENDRRYVQGDGSALMATLIFSAKEAAYKALSPYWGRVVDFAEFEVSGWWPQEGRLHLSPVSGSVWQSAIPVLPVNYCLSPSDTAVHTWVDVRQTGWLPALV